MMFSMDEYRKVLESLHEVGILQAFKACDDKRLTARLIIEIEYNQGGIRAATKDLKTKLK